MNVKKSALGEVIVPDGKLGNWAVESFTVTQAQADVYNLMHMGGKGDHHTIVAGDYKKLVHYCEERKANQVVMSNTPMEIFTNQKAADMATGRVLINGLGLGMLLHYILQKPDVTEVVVVERDEDVIALVAPSFSRHPKLTIVYGDAFTHQPMGKFDFAWHDIWTYINDENLKEMDLLEARYDAVAKEQLCWARDDCLEMKRMMDEFEQTIRALRGEL